MRLPNFTAGQALLALVLIFVIGMLNRVEAFGLGIEFAQESSLPFRSNPIYVVDVPEEKNFAHLAPYVFAFRFSKPISEGQAFQCFAFRHMSARQRFTA